MPLESDTSEPSVPNLRASLADGASYSVMLALGETNFQLFAVALAAGETLVGLVASVPMLLGAIVQLFAPSGLKWLRNYQQWIVWSSAVQATSLLLLPVAVCLGSSWGIACVLLATSLYWSGVMSCGPAWNTWIEGMLPLSIRTRFLASRARVSQVCAMLGFLGGGIAIQVAATHWTDRTIPAPSSVLTVFVVLFLIAAAARYFSVYCLVSHRPPMNDLPTQGPGIGQFFLGKGDGPASQLIYYLLAMQVAVQISGPFFIPYMLKERNLNPFAVVMIFSLCFLGKALAMPVWGRIAQRLGAERLFWIGGLAIMPMSALWVISDSFGRWDMIVPFSWETNGPQIAINGMLLYLGFVQFLSGITWSAYELAMSLMFLEAIPREQRTKMLTYYNFGNASAMMLGSMIGGTILWNLAESQAGYMVLFGSSSLARLGVLGIFALIAMKAGTAGRRTATENATSPAMPSLRVIFPEDEQAITQPLPPLEAVLPAEGRTGDQATAI